MLLDEKRNFRQKISARVHQNKIKGHKKIMSCESGFKIQQPKKIFRKQQANRALVMACLQNYQDNCCLQLFTEFIQTKKR